MSFSGRIFNRLKKYEVISFFFFFFFILIKFTKTNNYNTKAKGAWKYITTLRPTLNMETQILQQVTRY